MPTDGEHFASDGDDASFGDATFDHQLPGGWGTSGLEEQVIR